jgi:hypothetical protein
MWQVAGGGERKNGLALQADGSVLMPLTAKYDIKNGAKSGGGELRQKVKKRKDKRKIEIKSKRKMIENDAKRDA